MAKRTKRPSGARESADLGKKRGPGGARPGAGRPKIELDLRQLEELAKIGCTDEEIVAVLGCSVDTLSRRREDTPDVALAYDKGRASYKVSIRRALFSAANQCGEIEAPRNAVAAAIFLAKQPVRCNGLGMKDRWDDPEPTDRAAAQGTGADAAAVDAALAEVEGDGSA